MRGSGCGLLLVALSCWVPMPVAAADPAVSAGAASAVEAARSPEEDYRLGMKFKEEDSLPDAIRLFMRAAQHGHAAAQAEAADILETGSAFKPALELWRKSAEQGYAPGQFGLGMMYAAIDRDEVKQDFIEARKWVTLAANQGYAPAIHLLADAYLNGRIGLGADAQSSPEALAWIKRAADIDHVPAIQALASAYRSGRYGLAVDPAQADALDAKAKKILGIKEEKKTRRRN